MIFTDVQRALSAAGFNPGPIDGVPGARSRAAIRAFQTRNGLVVDGIAGPITQNRLAVHLGGMVAPLANAIAAELPWMIEANRLVGTTEIAGKGHSPVIIGWAEALDLSYAADETPWCGLFVCHCLTATLPDAPVPTPPLAARSWQRFGKTVPPQFGAVLVFWRGSKQGWSGHVGFYWGEDDLCYHVLGGNQSNQVNITRVAKTRLLSARWPADLPAKGARRFMTANGANVSVNEA